MAEHVVELGLYQNSVDKDDTVNNQENQRKHTSWTHEHKGTVSLDYSGCVFTAGYTGAKFGNDPNINIKALSNNTINLKSGFTRQEDITFDSYKIAVPSKYGETELFVNQSMDDQSICPRGRKDGGFASPGLIYEPQEGSSPASQNKMVGTNHTYQVPNAGVLRLTYAELMSETYKKSDSSNKLGLFGSDTGRVCSAEYCHDISKVCGIETGTRKAEVSMRLTRINNVSDTQLSFNNGITATAQSVIKGMHTKVGGENQCQFSMRLSEPCKDSLILNVNTAADNAVIVGEMSYERQVNLGSWCAPSTSSEGCPDRVAVKFQVPDYLRTTVAAGDKYQAAAAAETNTPTICQINYCTRILGFDVPIFISRATNMNGSADDDAWFCGVQPKAVISLEHDAEWKGCPCPEGGEDEDKE
jgi:hypothetical protein